MDAFLLDPITFDIIIAGMNTVLIFRNIKPSNNFNFLTIGEGYHNFHYIFP